MDGFSWSLFVAAAGVAITHTVLGPDHQNFAEMVRALVDGGAALVSPEPWLAVERVLTDDAVRRDMSQAGPRTVANHAGATAKNVEVVRQQLR